MGVSTDGILFYGFAVEEDSPLHERLVEETGDGEVETDDIVAKLYGWDGVSPESSWQWEKEHPSPVTIGMHCSYDYPMYYIAVKASDQSNKRGYPTKVNTTADPTWDGLLRDLCEKLGVDCPESFNWTLVSMWG